MHLVTWIWILGSGSKTTNPITDIRDSIPMDNDMDATNMLMTLMIVKVMLRLTMVILMIGMVLRMRMRMLMLMPIVILSIMLWIRTSNMLRAMVISVVMNVMLKLKMIAVLGMGHKLAYTNIGTWVVDHGSCII